MGRDSENDHDSENDSVILQNTNPSAGDALKSSTSPMVQRSENSMKHSLPGGLGPRSLCLMTIICVMYQCQTR